MFHATQVDVEKGQSLLEVLVGDDDCALLVRDMPSALVWRPAEGRPRHHVLRAYDTMEVEDRLAQWRLGRRGHTPGHTLESQLQPVLRLLTPGPYGVMIHPSLETSSGPPADGFPGGTTRTASWLGLHELSVGDDPLIGTVPRELLDEDRIDTIARHVRDGERPLVLLLTAEDACATFLVAGHHALEAYRRVGEAPAAVVLEAQDPARLTVDDGCTLIREAYERCALVTSMAYADTRVTGWPQREAG